MPLAGRLQFDYGVSGRAVTRQMHHTQHVAYGTRGLMSKRLRLDVPRSNDFPVHGPMYGIHTLERWGREIH